MSWRCEIQPCALREPLDLLLERPRAQPLRAVRYALAPRAWPDHPSWMREFVRLLRDHAPART